MQHGLLLDTTWSRKRKKVPLMIDWCKSLDERGGVRGTNSVQLYIRSFSTFSTHVREIFLPEGRVLISEDLWHSILIPSSHWLAYAPKTTGNTMHLQEEEEEERSFLKKWSIREFDKN